MTPLFNHCALKFVIAGSGNANFDHHDTASITAGMAQVSPAEFLFNAAVMEHHSTS